MEIAGTTIDKGDEKEASLILELIEIAKTGKTVRMLGIGNSMQPLLKSGEDYIWLEAVKEQERLKRGDVILYFSAGHFILHRIFRVTERGYEMLGDGNVMVEPPIPREQIYLKAVVYEKNGKKISASRWDMIVFGRVWLRIRPLRPWIRRGFRWVRRKIGKGGRNEG